LRRQRLIGCTLLSFGSRPSFLSSGFKSLSSGLPSFIGLAHPSLPNGAEANYPVSSMSETQFQEGVQDLRKRLSLAGLKVLTQQELFDKQSIYFKIGSETNNTDFAVSRNFLSDFQRTKDYLQSTNEYIAAVAGRYNCGSPEHFYCSSGLAIQVSISWPVRSAVYGNQFKTVILLTTTDLKTGSNSKNSIEYGSSVGCRTAFDYVPAAVNIVRAAADLGELEFVEPNTYQEVWKRVERREVKPCSQDDVEDFLCGKAFMLGFMVASAPPADIWAVDPWDATYLGVTTREILLGMRSLIAKGLFEQTIGPEYAKPSNKLLSEWSSRTSRSDAFQAQQNLTRTKLPLLEELLRDIATFLPPHPLSALILVDLDHFKRFNDAKGHLAGDACLDRAFHIIRKVVGRRGRIYKWGHGGDEMSAFLPDFSTDEAQLIAERIRRAMIQEKLGEDLPVTASIGVCATDRAEWKSPEEFVERADQAVFESKRRGRNCVTIWPFTPTDNPVEDKV
jgi:diguanylate cyclase (GGDEF)-like protein